MFHTPFCRQSVGLKDDVRYQERSHEFLFLSQTDAVPYIINIILLAELLSAVCCCQRSPLYWWCLIRLLILLLVLSQSTVWRRICFDCHCKSWNRSQDSWHFVSSRVTGKRKMNSRTYKPGDCSCIHFLFLHNNKKHSEPKPFLLITEVTVRVVFTCRRGVNYLH